MNVTDSKPTEANGAWKDVRVSLGPDAEVTGKLSFATPTRIEVVAKGAVRRAKLYYLRERAGRAARVTEEA